MCARRSRKRGAVTSSWRSPCPVSSISMRPRHGDRVAWIASRRSSRLVKELMGMVTILSPCVDVVVAFSLLLSFRFFDGQKMRFCIVARRCLHCIGKATFEGLWYTDYPCYPIRAFRLKIIHCLERVLCGLCPRT